MMKYKIRFKSNSNLINTTDAESWISNNIDVNEKDDKNSKNQTQPCCGLSYVHLSFFVTVVCAFIFVFLNADKFISTNSRPNFVELIGQPDIPVFSRNSLSNPPFWKLLDINNFRVLQEPPKKFCEVDDLLFLLVVHSKPDHFRQRQAVRATWGSLQNLNVGDNKIWATRTVFILGEDNEQDSVPPLLLGQSVNELLLQESLKYKDIVLGSFQDEYHNLRYKHILGLRWASNHCSNAIFFLKADDDAFIDLPGLQRFLSRTFGTLSKDLKDVLAGNVFPSGTPPQRKGKWAVSTAEYPWSEYPAYLGGLAYLMTPEVAADLHKVAHANKVPQVWVDDVWVTGLLAKSLHLQPILLNPQYSYDHSEMAKWVKSLQTKSSHVHSSPFTFAHLDPSQTDWKNTYQKLWSQVMLAHNITLKQ